MFVRKAPNSCEKLFGICMSFAWTHDQVIHFLKSLVCFWLCPLLHKQKQKLVNLSCDLVPKLRIKAGKNFLMDFFLSVKFSMGNSENGHAI